jgi:hypothetical protein
VNLRTRFGRLSFLLLLLPLALSPLAQGQFVVQRGALGQPSQVFDETNQWTTPILVAEDHDVQMYIPDVSNQTWLANNYLDFRDKGQFVISMFTLYKTPKACQANQIGWGNSDGASLDACNNDIGYRVRQASIDSRQKTVTLIMAAMVDPNGQIVPDTVRHDRVSRNWNDLDANSQTALEKATALIVDQMKHYDRRQQGIR